MRPFDDWGNVKWSVIVGDLPKDPEPPVPLIDQPAVGGNGFAVPVRPPSPEPEPDDVLKCPHCTYNNLPSATVCFVCE